MPPSDTLQPRRLRLAGKVVVLATWLSWGLCAISCGIMLIEVESVLFTGPLIFAAGVGLLLVAKVTRCRPAAWIGLGNCLICVVFFGAVQAYDWSPAEAYTPFAIMGAGYVLGLLPLNLYTYGKAPRISDDRCGVCGYLLIGLPEPRCPECGTPFDPSTVRGSVDT